MTLSRTVRTSFLCKFLHTQVEWINQRTYLGSAAVVVAAAASYCLLPARCKPTKAKLNCATSTYCTCNRLIIYSLIWRDLNTWSTKHETRLNEWKMKTKLTLWRRRRSVYKRTAATKLGSARVERERAAKWERERVEKRVRNWESGQSAECDKTIKFIGRRVRVCVCEWNKHIFKLLRDENASLRKTKYISAFPRRRFVVHSISDCIFCLLAVVSLDVVVDVVSPRCVHYSKCY